MKLRLALLVVVAALALPAAASAQYNLTNDAAAVIVTPASQTSVAVEYSSFCLVIFVCPATQSVSSSNGVTFTNSGANCAQGADATQFSCQKRPNTRITGANGADRVSGSCFGSNSSLVFSGFDGDDEVSAAACTGSTVNMGGGNDRATASGTVNGEVGNDDLTGGTGADSLDGGDGRDTVAGGGGADILRGGNGRDLLLPGPGAGDVVQGGADLDTGSYEDQTAAVTVTLDDQANDGPPGENDRMASDVENLIGGVAGDTLIGDGNPNDIDGGDGGDVINPGGGPDFVDGGPGNDRIEARDGAQDRILCGDGNDLAITDEFDTVVACETVQSSRELMPDVDNDGVVAGAGLDCDDRDPRRRPGFTDKPGNGIDEDCSGADAPFTRILSPIQSTFTTRGRVTRVLRLRVLAVPEGGRIELRCAGGTKRGCFRGVKRFRSRRGAERLNVRKPVRRSRMRTGSRLEVRVLDADSIGKVVRFTMRTRKLPSSRSLCLVPGRKSPGRCPRS
jgi:RTX calcium-binding nonapeptide repeat (4 copies)/Putative metal-binding motif